MSLNPLPRSTWKLLPVLGTLALAGCVTVVDNRPPPGHHRPDRPQVCTREYQPVCATRGRDRQTFPNACEARGAGYRIDHSGTCRGRPDRPPPVRPDRPQACTMEYMPVCGRVGGSLQTFGNSCTARAAGAEIVGRGECRGGPPRGRR